MHQHHTRALAAISGALLADALGVPHEFKAAELIPRAEDIQLVMPPGYKRTYPGTPYGTWSDDGSQLLCLLQTLSDNAGELDLDHFGKLLVQWWRNARHQSGGIVFDCGGQTGRALAKLAGGVPVGRAGSGAGQTLGNGSLMRTLPAALAPILWGLPAEAVISIAARQSIVTHPHPVAQVCCAVYAALAYQWLKDPALSLPAALAESLYAIRAHPIAAAPEMQSAIQLVAGALAEGEPSGSGYCVSTLFAAIWAVEHNDTYLGAVRSVIRLGGDTDTTACVAGGLASLRYGLDSVPDTWCSRLIMPAESCLLLQRLGRVRVA
jgi:ADP-ribosyl-[dinitrogen reductase] hydrolase